MGVARCGCGAAVRMASLGRGRRHHCGHPVAGNYGKDHRGWTTPGEFLKSCLLWVLFQPLFPHSLRL